MCGQPPERLGRANAPSKVWKGRAATVTGVIYVCPGLAFMKAVAVTFQYSLECSV